MRVCVLVSVLLVLTAAFPADPVLYKLDEQRYHYTLDGDGVPHLVDLWVKASDLEKMARYNPDSQNIYHLFTSIYCEGIGLCKERIDYCCKPIHHAFDN